MPTLLTFTETKHFLNISRATLYRWAAGNTIPAIKMGGQWRFDKEQLDKWLDDQENLKKEKLQYEQ